LSQSLLFYSKGVITTFLRFYFGACSFVQRFIGLGCEHPNYICCLFYLVLKLGRNKTELMAMNFVIRSMIKSYFNKEKGNVLFYCPPNIPCIASPIPPKGFVWFSCAYDVLTANPTKSNSDSTNGSAINSDLFIEKISSYLRRQELCRQQLTLVFLETYWYNLSRSQLPTLRIEIWAVTSKLSHPAPNRTWLLHSESSISGFKVSYT
jgi:hypothetical protein